MPDATDLARELNFIAKEAKTPADAIWMVATMIDGVTAWANIGPLSVRTNNGESLTEINSKPIHLHDMLKGF